MGLVADKRLGSAGGLMAAMRSARQAAAISPSRCCRDRFGSA